MDEPGQISPRRDSLIKEVLRPLGPETFPELLRRKPDIAAGDTTIAGGCALADQALFQNDDVFACPGERQACRQPGEAASDDGDIGMLLPFARRGRARWPFLPPVAVEILICSHRMTMSNCR